MISLLSKRYNSDERHDNQYDSNYKQKIIKSNSKRNDYLNEKISITLYVGNLPKTWNEDDIRNYFNNYGKILDVQIIKKNRNFSGAALVKFQSLTNAEDAIQRLKNTTIPGAHAPLNMKWSDIDEHRLGILQNDDHKLFIKSLPRQANTATLHQVFTLLGDVEQIHLQQAKYWAFVKYKKKQSALLAIKILNGQTFLHGSRIPIEVRFKEKKYNSEPDSKKIEDPMNIYPTIAVYREIYLGQQHYYVNCMTMVSQYQTPPVGSLVYRMDDSYYYQQDYTSTENLNDMPTIQRMPGPVGANLFVFHLPNNMKDSQLCTLFKKYGNILSARVMTKDGKSKGFGFVSFDTSKAANDAIQELNGLQIGGKRLKVQLKKGNENNTSQLISSLKQVNFNPL